MLLTSCGGKPAAQVTATPSAPAPAGTETTRFSDDGEGRVTMLESPAYVDAQG